MADIDYTIPSTVPSHNNVSVFNFKDAAVRVFIDENGGPWFIAKDVCDILGINTTHVRRGLDDDEVLTLPNWKGKGVAPLIISESGLYSLTLKSRKPVAKPFQRWVTHDVLPAIRRTGGYNTAASLERLIANPDLVIGLATQLKQAKAAQVEAETALNDFTSPAGSYSLRDAAKILNRTPGIKTGGTRLSRWLVEHNWCYREQDGKESYLVPY